MNTEELERRLNEEDLMIVYDAGIKKSYINGNKVFINGIFRNHVNVFGIYFDGKRYCNFITDSDKGYQLVGKYCLSEEDACESLYKEIKDLNEIHINKLKKVLSFHIEDEKIFEKYLNHIDIATEFINAIKINDWPWPKIKVLGYTAKYLSENYDLNIVDAYSCLIDLREMPDETLKKLKKNTKRLIKIKK